jgi:hypothetical protein
MVLIIFPGINNGFILFGFAIELNIDHIKCFNVIKGDPGGSSSHQGLKYLKLVLPFFFLRIKAPLDANGDRGAQSSKKHQTFSPKDGSNVHDSFINLQNLLFELFPLFT